MFDETNQMMEGGAEELPESLFEDEDTSSTAGGPPSPQGEGIGENKESGGDSQTEQNADDGAGGVDQTEANEEGTAATIRVKYNGEEKDISLDEARTLAQKGLNYDHVVQERDRNRSAFNFLLERAKGEGITVEELIEREKGQAENKRLEAKMEELRRRDDDASEDTIKNLARFELEAERMRAEKEKSDALKEKEKADIEGWSKLFRVHPELIDASGGAKVSQGVFDLVKQGYSPVEAYYMERNRELEAQNKMFSDAETSKKKSVGSLSGVQAAEEDDFLAGFNGE